MSASFKIGWNIIYYLTSVFLLIPLAIYWGSPFFPWVLLATLLYLLSYLICIHSHSPWLQLLAWFYMTLYNMGMLYGNPNSFLNLLYQSNLLSYRFTHERLSEPKGILFVAELLIASTLLARSALSTGSLDVNLTGVWFIALLMLLIRSLLKREAIKQELLNQHQTVNLLLAEQERARIAKDLHDSLGHVFVTLSVKSQLLQQYLNQGQYEEAKEENQSVLDLIRENMAQVRQIVQGVQQLAVPDELEALQDLLHLAGLETNFEVPEPWEALEAERELHLAMLLRELCNNVLKHSSASTCRLRLQREAMRILLQIEDDGVGLRPEQNLKSVETRVHDLGGRLEVESWVQPTCLKITLPLEGRKSS